MNKSEGISRSARSANGVTKQTALAATRHVASSFPRRFLHALIATLGIAGCKPDIEEPQVGSETNFLMHCSETCGDGFTCLCGYCTHACTADSECMDAAPNARCVSVPEDPATGSTTSCSRGATCDAACVTRSDCATLGADYECESGYCRKGALVCPPAALAPGDYTRDLLVNGTRRSYLLHVPASYRGDTRVPLVLDFHPLAIGADYERATSGFLALSDAQGFIIAWPSGTENTWNVGPCCSFTTPADDFSFARSLVRRLSADFCVDPLRVHAVGFSGGGLMAYYLGCQQAEVFASIAVSSIDLLSDSELVCSPSRPVSEISFRGGADTVIAYQGGTSSPAGHPEMVHEFLGAVGTFRKWAELNGCAGAPTAEDASGCSTYDNCDGGSEVTLCTIAGGAQVMGDAQRAWTHLSRHPM